jgi:hypothetical protein
MNRMARLLIEAGGWSHPYQVPILRIAAISLLALILMGRVVLLFQIQSPQGAALALLLGAGIDSPFFAVGRRHARWAGNKASAQSYNH